MAVRLSTTTDGRATNGVEVAVVVFRMVEIVYSRQRATVNQVLSLGDAIEPLKTKSREIGANGMIIDKSQPVKSGFIPTGVYVEARAIRIKNRN